MADVAKKDYQQRMEEQELNTRRLVTEGLEQIKKGKTRDFNAVCDRLEKKYRYGTISD